MPRIREFVARAACAADSQCSRGEYGHWAEVQGSCGFANTMSTYAVAARPTNPVRRRHRRRRCCTARARRCAAPARLYSRMLQLTHAASTLTSRPLRVTGTLSIHHLSSPPHRRRLYTARARRRTRRALPSLSAHHPRPQRAGCYSMSRCIDRKSHHCRRHVLLAHHIRKVYAVSSRTGSASATSRFAQLVQLFYNCAER
ncbi:hypothetical protein C8R47DRAFT_1320147 [Mycena vitilis]|nr:hypothetical protein C8R47DRAFT_1320147 [Mycena vitilis]